MLDPATPWLPLEFHLWPNVRSGYVHCPNSFRILDLLNYVGDAHPFVMSEFFEYVDLAAVSTDSPAPDAESEYVRKSTVDMVAVSKGNVGRGVGAIVGKRAYPYRHKVPVSVKVELRHYTLYGSLHCSAGHTIRNVLGMPLAFFPLTDVTISHDSGLYGTRPFVAVNKSRVVSVKREAILS